MEKLNFQKLIIQSFWVTDKKFNSDNSIVPASTRSLLTQDLNNTLKTAGSLSCVHLEGLPT